MYNCNMIITLQISNVMTINLILLIPSSLLISSVLSDDKRPFVSEGGWRTYPSDMVARPGPCNIDIKDRRLTQEQFMEQYAKTQPFIVRDAANNDLFRALARK